MNKLYILLPVHNRRETTQQFLESLKQQTYQNYHLVLIDDGSTDGTADMVTQEIESLTVIEGTGNWWWGGALHQGYLWLQNQEIADNDLILMMNDDIEFEPNFLEIGVNLMQQYQQTLLMAENQMKYSDRAYRGTHINWWKFQFSQVQPNQEISCLCTSALFLRSRDFKKIGGFYPNRLPHYLSDYEFTLRAKRKGLKLTTNSNLKIIRDDSQTGYHNLKVFMKDSWQNTLKAYFSQKSSHNPITFTNFILVASPWQWKLLNLITVWAKAGIKILYLIIFSQLQRKPIERSRG